jgi:hypothetical protein
MEFAVQQATDLFRYSDDCSNIPVKITHIDAPIAKLNSLSDPERVMIMD